MNTNETHPPGSLQRMVRRRQPDPHSEYPEIAEMKAALNRAGYDASEADIQWAWEEHSEDWAAGWLVLESCGGPDGAVKYLLEYLTAESPNDQAQRPGTLRLTNETAAPMPGSLERMVGRRKVKLTNMKMAKADHAEWQRVMDFVNELEQQIKYEPSAEKLGEWVRNSHVWCGRVVYGFRVLVDNACDPNADTLEWKPEIAAAIAAYKKPDAPAEPSNDGAQIPPTK